MAKPVRAKKVIPDYEPSKPSGFGESWDQCEFVEGEDQCGNRALRQGRYDEKRGRPVYRWCREHDSGELIPVDDDRTAKVREIISTLSEKYRL